ncbi:MAG: bsn 2 [Bacteroidetes bacterium]|jgi:endonuclease I|nr:bsn 2 [Bacteroidota bacterium]
MKKAVLFFLCIQSYVWAQIPSGYYNSAQGLTGIPLRQALHNIIDNHTSISYNALWTAYQTTDKKTNGKVWDMYSDIPSGTPPYQFTFISDQCGNYVNEGDCYNREHVWPQSAFNSDPPMVSDLFHIYPTDGKVNGIRSNYAFGNTGTTVYNTTMNGSQLGICDNCGGFSGVAFEPIDAYKGDIARSIFYMSTRYYTEDASWNAAAFANKAELYQWAIDILIGWHHLDPVSQKETDRNNDVYGIQDNRNPYIDHPEWADSVFPATAVGLKESATALSFSLYPNPSTGSFRIHTDTNGEEYSVTLFNSLGEQVLKEKYATAEISLEPLLPEGIYLIRIETANGKSNTATFIRAAGN